LTNRINPATHTHHYAARLSSVLLPVLAFAAGFGAFYSWTSLEVSTQWAGYLALAVLAGIDSVLGGVRAGMEGKFHSDVFLSGFVLNTVITVAFVWFGDAIGIPELYVAAVVVLGWRIFLNSSLIRRFFIERGRASRAALESSLSAERGMPPVASDSGSDTLPGNDIVGAQ
jgi:small basic protein